MNKTTCKFILNRNEGMHYYYVEKQLNKDIAQYLVHSNNRIEKYNATNFNNTFALDEKQAISIFVRKAILELIPQMNTNKEASEITSHFENVLNACINQDKKNPNLGSTEKSLLIGLESYNKILDSIRREDIIPYEDNYQFVLENKPNNKEIEPITKVKSYPSPERHEYLQNEKGFERIKKYDN